MSNNNNGRDVTKTVNAAVSQFHAKHEELIPILMKVNKELGYIPGEALEQISEAMHIPQSRVYSVASFYHMISTKPTGRHVIKFCESAPCHVAGGKAVWDALLEELQIKPGETSPDGKWTLKTTSCLGVCAVGPVMMVDDDIYGNVEPDQVPDILGKYE
ncbi:MAG: NADH-quinone oxidoreductase subunit [Chloroflexota bacterium]|nr:NADH-quinone oxidoreductase subunit [Chloroflexota bacterium]